MEGTERKDKKEGIFLSRAEPEHTTMARWEMRRSWLIHTSAGLLQRYAGVHRDYYIYSVLCMYSVLCTPYNTIHDRLSYTQNWDLHTERYQHMGSTGLLDNSTLPFKCSAWDNTALVKIHRSQSTAKIKNKIKKGKKRKKEIKQRGG